MESLPNEVKEIIIFYCHGETLFNLRLVNKHWRDLVDSEDQRNKLFRKCLKLEVPKHQLQDVTVKLYPNRKYLHQNFWIHRNIYAAYLRWKNLNQRNFVIKKLRSQLVNISSLKTSRFTILVGDKNGFHMFNSKTGAYVTHYLGPIKYIELLSLPKSFKDVHYGYDRADITTDHHKHYIFNLRHQEFKLLKTNYERQSRKCWDFKRLEIREGSHFRSIKLYDFFEENVLLVTQRHIIVAGPSRTNKTEFDGEGARAWYSYHCKLVLCSKDETFTAFVDGRYRMWRFYEFPPITAMFYYSGWFLFGTKYGSVYGYRCNVEDILSLVLKNYDLKWDVCPEPIAHLSVLEDEEMAIVVATEKEIYLIVDKRD